MTNSNAKGGFFGKALAAACSLALVASLTPAAAVSAFAATAQKAPETLTLTIQQLGSNGDVVNSASLNLTKGDNLDKYLVGSSASSVIFRNNNSYGVATVASSSASTITDFIEKVQVDETGDPTLLSKVTSKAIPDNATVTVESGYNADNASTLPSNVTPEFVQTVTMSWNDLKNSKNYYPATTKSAIKTAPVGETGALLVQSGKTVFTPMNDTFTTAAEVATYNQTKESKETWEKYNNGFTFIKGITANEARNNYPSTEKMVQGVNKITLTIPYGGLNNTDRVYGTNWDDTMIDTLDAVTGDTKTYKRLTTTDGQIVADMSATWNKNIFVVATAGGFQDALSASGFAGVLEAPLLMTDPNTLTPSTQKYIEDNIVPGKQVQIYLIGGPNAVSDAVKDQLMAIDGVANTYNGFVERIYGEEAWDTSLAIYNWVNDHDGVAWEEGYKTVNNSTDPNAANEHEIIVASSYTFEDALSVSPYAYAEKLPVILTNNTSVLSDEVAAAMQDDIESDTTTNKIASATIVGGPVAVSTVVNNQLLQIPVNRLWGTTAYDTSNAIATYLVKEVTNFQSTEYATMATGKQYYDALSSCNFTGTQKAVLLLVDGDVDGGTVCISDFLTKYGPDGKNKVDYGIIFGGTAVVTEGTQILADDALAGQTYQPYALL